MCDALSFERTWNVWLKLNKHDWNLNNFTKLLKVATIPDMWGLLHHLPDSIVSTSNLFVMEEHIVPLTEMNEGVFDNGGAWSVVMKRCNVFNVINETFMALMGELTFSERVKGACIVPVNTNHVIVKIWTSSKNDEDADALYNSMAEYNPSAPRFKAFT